MIPLQDFLDKPKMTVTEYLWYVDCEIDQWYSYVHYGLLNEIQNNTRKHQRYYQRKFCSWLSRKNRIIQQHPEYFI